MDDFREWLSDNLRYILLGLAIALIAVIVICAVRLAGGSSKKDETRTTAAKVTEKAADAEKEDSGDDSSASSSAAPAAGSDLVKDDEQILALVEKYYTAVAAKDTATLATIVNPWNSDIESSILSNTVIESYDNISTYSKAGPEDGTYVVYAYYDGKIVNISTEAPSLALLYVVTDDSGNLVVGDRNSSAEVSDFIQKATAAADVQALKNDVNQKLVDAEASDADLKAFIDSQNSGEAQTESSTEGDSSSQTAAAGSTATTTAGVNIRAEASADGAIVGVTYAGAEVTVIERGDQWTHINFEYQGTTYDGYVATQYLDFGDSSASAADDSASASSDSQQASSAAGTASADTAV